MSAECPRNTAKFWRLGTGSGKFRPNFSIFSGMHLNAEFSEGRGHRFESCRARQHFQQVTSDLIASKIALASE
jgi:hypothetical protein